MSRDMSPEAVKARTAKLYEGAVEKEAYLANDLKTKAPDWKPKEKKFALKIPGADRSITEAQVLADIDKYAKENRIFYKRINTQGVLMMTGPNTARMATNSMKGMSDYYLCVEGISLWCEVKKPTGSYTELQSNFIKDIINYGGVAGIVTSVRDLERLIRCAVLLREKPLSTADIKSRLLKIAFNPGVYDV